MDQQTLLLVSIFWLLAALFAAPLRAGEPVAPAATISADIPATLWIDVRTAEEYQAGHLSGAVNIPYDQIGSRIGELAPDPRQPIQLYCRSGRRAAIAKQTLEAMGYSQVHNAGGYQQAVAARAETLAGSH